MPYTIKQLSSSQLNIPFSANFSILSDSFTASVKAVSLAQFGLAYDFIILPFSAYKYLGLQKKGSNRHATLQLDIEIALNLLKSYDLNLF
jgi:hypothetical protein